MAVSRFQRGRSFRRKHNRQAIASRKYAKKQMVRLIRRLAKIDPEDVPERYPYKGYCT